MSIDPYGRTSDIGSSIMDIANSEIHKDKLDPIDLLMCKDIRTESLSILVIGTQEMCERLGPTMRQMSKDKYKGDISIKITEDIGQVFDSGIAHTSIDYVALVCDTTFMGWPKKAMDNLERLKSLTASSKLCLVNGTPTTGLEGSDMEFVRIAETNGLLYINGEIKNQRSCVRVAERLMGLATTTSGYRTGTPFIFPTTAEIYSAVVKSARPFNK